MAYAILRTVKLKAAGNIGGLNSHLTRSMDVPNADRELGHLNQQLRGSDNLWEDVNSRIQAENIVPRKNAVYAVEHLITYSPEWIGLKKIDRDGKKQLVGKKGDISNIKSFFEKSTKWLEDRYGSENLVNVHVHYDEKTPHMHAIVVPIKGNKLNCRAYLGGRDKLREMQTDFASRMSDLGLKRGIEGSKAEHVELKDFYGMVKIAKRSSTIKDLFTVNGEVPLTKLSISKPPIIVLNRNEWVGQEEERINTEVSDQVKQVEKVFQKKIDVLSEHIKSSVLSDFKRVLEKREQKYLLDLEMRLKTSYDGKNAQLNQKVEELNWKLKKMHYALLKQGLKFDEQSEKILQIKPENQMKIGGKLK